MNASKFVTLALVCGVMALTPQSLRAEHPFTNFTGSWSGSGTITVQDGSRERIRCRGTYRAGDGGSTLSLSLRCASDSYKFELVSDISYDGGIVSGTWNEASRQVYGSLTGRSTSNSIQATAAAVGFTATLSLTTRGNNQNVSIRSPGSEISEVSISMARSGR